MGLLAARQQPPVPVGGVVLAINGYVLNGEVDPVKFLVDRPVTLDVKVPEDKRPRETENAPSQSPAKKAKVDEEEAAPAEAQQDASTAEYKFTYTARKKEEPKQENPYLEEAPEEEANAVEETE